jgi:hypothetical protein
VSQPPWAVVGQPYGVVDDLQRVTEIPAQFGNLRERDHGDARDEGIAGRYGHWPCLRGGGCGAVKVSQYQAGQARPRLGLGPLGAGEQGRLACPLQLTEPITSPTARHQGVPETHLDGALHGWVVVSA